MFRSIRIYTLLLALALLGSSIGTANRAQAQTYQIDCAILLCLSGGWPASVPCASARAEFIRRVTPWPIEPPLQIWRCPMGASYHPDGQSNDLGRLYDILFSDQDRPRPLSLPATGSLLSQNAILKLASPEHTQHPHGFALQFIQDRADIDISGPEFNFVPSGFMMSGMRAKTSQVAMVTVIDPPPFTLALMEPKVIFHGLEPHLLLFLALIRGWKDGDSTVRASIIGQSSFIGATTTEIMGSNRSITDGA